MTKTKDTPQLLKEIKTYLNNNQAIPKEKMDDLLHLTERLYYYMCDSCCKPFEFNE